MAYGRLAIAAGHFHFFHRVPSLIAQQRGYFKQEGLLEVEITAPGEDELSLRDLKLKRIDIELDLRATMALGENSKGEDIYIIGAFINGLALSFFGAKEINSIEDLKGKRIGLGEKGGAIDARLIKILLAKHGIDPDRDVSYVLDKGWPSLENQGSRLDRGDYQGATLIGPYVQQAIDAGYNHLADFEEAYPDGYPHRVTVTSGRIIKDYPEMLKAFCKATIRAYRFCRNEKNWGEVRELIERYPWERDFGWQKFDRSTLKTPYLGFRYVPADGLPSMKGLEVMVAEDKASGRLPQTYTTDQILRLDFMEEAAKEIDARYGPEGYE